MSKPLPQPTGFTIPASAVLAFPHARTPRGLRVTPSRAYRGPRSDDTVSLMLTADGIVDAASVEIDETATVEVKVAAKVYALKRPWRSIVANFKRAHGLAAS